MGSVPRPAKRWGRARTISPISSFVARDVATAHRRVEVIVVEPDVRRDDVDVHPERVHVGQALFRRPAGARRQRLALAADEGELRALRIPLAPERVPVASVVRRSPEALWGEMGVDVDGAHNAPFESAKYNPATVGRNAGRDG